MNTNIRQIRERQIAHANKLTTQLHGFKDEGLKRASHKLQNRHKTFHSALQHVTNWRARLIARIETAERDQEMLTARHQNWLDSQVVL